MDTKTTDTTEFPPAGTRGPYGRISDGTKWVNAPKKAVAVAKPPAVEGEVLESQDEVLKQLAEFASLMGDAVKKKSDTKKVLDQVAELLNGLDPSAYGEVLSHPIVEKLAGVITEAKAKDPGIRPGEDLGPAIGKKPYTMGDFRRDPAIKWVEYTPRHTVPVTLNGVLFQLYEDQTVLIPEEVRNIAEASRLAPRLAKEHIDYMFRKRDSVSDPTILSDGSRRVRGRYSGGLAGVGTGLALDVPEADRPGFADIGGTEVGEAIGETANV